MWYSGDWYIGTNVLEKNLPKQHNAYLVSNTDDLYYLLLVLSYYVTSRRLGWAGWQLVVWE